MASIETSLWSTISSYEPTAAQKEGAARSHLHLREILTLGELRPRIRDSFLSGSYSRDTAIRPIDDVDVIFLINWNAWPIAPGMNVPYPENVLNSFATVIRHRYPVSSVSGQRRSVCLEMNHLSIDVVPAIPHTQQDFIWVPDKRDNKWILSAPAIHSRLASEVNQSTQGYLKPLVKLLKAINGNLASGAVMKSFAIETICTQLFRTCQLPSLQDGLVRFFDFVAYISGQRTYYTWNNAVGMSLYPFRSLIPDAAQTGTNIVEGLEEARRNLFVSSAVRRRDLMLQIQTANPVGAQILTRSLIGT